MSSSALPARLRRLLQITTRSASGRLEVSLHCAGGSGLGEGGRVSAGFLSGCVAARVFLALAASGSTTGWGLIAGSGSGPLRPCALPPSAGRAGGGGGAPGATDATAQAVAAGLLGATSLGASFFDSSSMEDLA